MMVVGVVVVVVGVVMVVMVVVVVVSETPPPMPRSLPLRPPRHPPPWATPHPCCPRPTSTEWCVWVVREVFFTHT